MAGLDHLFAPLFICYLLLQIPPTLMEVYCYYVRGGLIAFDCHMDETWNANNLMYTDWYIYYKRFCDRPKSDAAKAFYSYLDWSAAAWDKSVYLFRRNKAKEAREVSPWKVDIYGPFRFNWKAAHDKQWARHNDAAAFGFPFWGSGGEERARAEYEKAKADSYKHWWHYQTPKKIKAEQEARKAAQAALEITGSK